MTSWHEYHEDKLASLIYHDLISLVAIDENVCRRHDMHKHTETRQHFRCDAVSYGGENTLGIL